MDPPPTNVFAVAAVMDIIPVPVPAVVVNPVGFTLFQALVVAEIAIVPPSNVMFFVPAPVAKLPVEERLNPAKNKVPFVSIKDDTDIASARVSEAPLEFIAIPPIAFPELVTIDVPTNNGVNAVYVPPEARVTFPYTFGDPETLHVLPVNINSLKVDPPVMVRVDAPAFTVRFIAFELDPPVVPKTTVAVEV